jgi:asparagine synthase (glutamine-hydrolysing)
MCGIAGWIDWQEELTNQRSIVEAMAATMRLRGPDAEGCWLSPRAALVQRRLIVIDPVSGGQPMVYQEGEYTYALTYNGETYNFRELRAELETLGHRFQTRSDTEVVLHAYLEWGEQFVTHLNGIFAFGLWDERRQLLLLGRDHLGVKPLFYAQRGSALIFGSEIKALLAHPLVKPEIDRAGLAEVFGLSLYRTPGVGVFRDVHEVRAGHLLSFERERTQVTHYWSLRSEPHTDDLATTTEHLRTLLEDIVRHQLIADVPVVAMLSGGLDSSGLTALAASEFRRQGKTLHTYSIDYAESVRDFQDSPLHPSMDAPWVKRVSEYAGTEHHTVTVDTPELIETLLVPMRAFDLPCGGQINASVYLLFKAMKRDATVTLSGESADEVFGGYPWYRNEAILNTPTFPWITMLSEASNGGAARFAPTAWLSDDLQRRIDPVEHLQRQYREALAEVPRLAGETPGEARMRETFYLGLNNFLPMLLDRKDRMSMATGFEARVPFCDHRLVQYVWNIPWAMKTTGEIEKGILRQAFTGVLPNDVLMRRKSAYPFSQNPSYLRALSDWVGQVITNPNAPILPLINVPVVKALTDRPTLGMMGGSAMMLMEKVIQIDAWLKEYHVTIC